jgi:hypothetical protein
MRRFLAAVALALMMSSCATITRGTTSQVQFHSDPPGAAMRTSHGHSCVTPCVLQMNRKDEFIATFSKPGYADQEVQVRTKLAGEGAAGFVGNVVIGGVVGMAADAATGATLEHIPNPVAVILEPLRLPPGLHAPAPTTRRAPPAKKQPAS